MSGRLNVDPSELDSTRQGLLNKLNEARDRLVELSENMRPEPAGSSPACKNAATGFTDSADQFLQLAARTAQQLDDGATLLQPIKTAYQSADQSGAGSLARLGL